MFVGSVAVANSKRIPDANRALKTPALSSAFGTLLSSGVGQSHSQNPMHFTARPIRVARPARPRL
eukprot:1612694-Rhodomonas_salina.3